MLCSNVLPTVRNVFAVAGLPFISIWYQHIHI